MSGEETEKDPIGYGEGGGGSASGAVGTEG